jgi:tripeptidyl-peptidase-1
MPSWQTTLVDAYWSTVEGTSDAPYEGYNSTNRGYPDVSLLANSYIILANGSFWVVSGTSASSPVMAGMVSLINSYRKEAGLSTMGFINPFLYTYYASFINYITYGNNSCTASSICCSHGYSAVSGWDPVTGLGSVNFTSFYTAAMSSPSTYGPTRLPTIAPFFRSW